MTSHCGSMYLPVYDADMARRARERRLSKPHRSAHSTRTDRNGVLTSRLMWSALTQEGHDNPKSGKWLGFILGFEWLLRTKSVENDFIAQALAGRAIDWI